MIPHRFVTEYAERCLHMLNEFEPIARKQNLYSTFSVMLASSVLVIPWERAGKQHPLDQEHGSVLQQSIRDVFKQKWQQAEFWTSGPKDHWRFSRIMGNPNDVRDWRDENESPSFSLKANSISKRRVGEVFRVLRNALAHGNIVYLDASGHENRDHPVEHIAFLSRYEESAEQREKTETYRIVIVDEAHFLDFIKDWALWVVKHQGIEGDLRVA